MKLEIDASGTNSIYGGVLIYLKISDKEPYMKEVSVNKYQIPNDKQRKNDIRDEVQHIVFEGLKALSPDPKVAIIVNRTQEIFKGLVDKLRREGYSLVIWDTVDKTTHTASEEAFGDILKSKYNITIYRPVGLDDKLAPIKNLNHQMKQLEERKDFVNVKDTFKRVKELRQKLS